MNVAYFPFTYLSEATANRLAALVGPVSVYQPIQTAVAAELNELASRGLIEIRTPLVGDDDRLQAALAEFTQWAGQNPGRLTAGADYLGARQGEVPFFDETAVNQIRSDLRHYGQSERSAKEVDDCFSARLFLALAQENDRAMVSLDTSLDTFKAMEKEFLETLEDADEAGFNRQAYGGTLWREDPGARLTGQRLRAWARLASVDERLPDVWITTSPAVIDLLMEHAGNAGGFEKLADVPLAIGAATEDPLLARVLTGLMDGSLALTADLAEAGLPPAAAEPDARVSLYATASQPATAFIEKIAAAKPPHTGGGSFGHTLVVLVQG